jgi:5'-3' exonuclease
VERIYIASPDKDLAQCVVADRVVQLDRRKREVRDEAGVWERFGVAPSSIPDWLALVGDAADGFPGLPRWGAKSASAVLARWSHVDRIPDDPADWDVKVRGAASLGESLREGRDLALLFRDLATLRTDATVFGSVDELAWSGPGEGFRAVCEQLRVPGLATQADELAAALPG